MWQRSLAVAVLAASFVAPTAGAGRAGTVSLRVRDFTPCPDKRLPPSVCAVNDGDYLLYDREIHPATTALILVDVWAEHANRDLMQRIDTNVRSSLLTMLKAVRADGRMLIVHYPNRRKIHPAVRTRSGEVVANTGEEALAAVRSRQVTTLIYAGYAGDMCLANRPLGVLSAYLLHGYRDIIVVRDASLSIEPPEWKNQGLAHQGAMLLLELNDYAVTTTVADVEQSLRRRDITTPAPRHSRP